MLDFAAFGGSVTLAGNHCIQSGQIVDTIDFLAASSLLVHATPSLPKLKLARLTGLVIAAVHLVCLPLRSECFCKAVEGNGWSNLKRLWALWRT